MASSLYRLLPHLSSLNQTKQSHALAVVSGLLPSSVSLCASLIRNYGKFGNPNLCQKLFQNSLFYCENSVLWNTLLRVYASWGMYDVFHVYNCMIKAGFRPNDHTFPSVIKACGDNYLVEKGEEVHGCVIKVGFDDNVYVSNTLLLFYNSCGDSESACKVFDEMPERDVVSWSSMIVGFAENNNELGAIELVRQMQAFGEAPDVVTFINVLPACARIGAIDSGKEIHGFSIRMGFDANLFISSSLIDLYAKSGHLATAVSIFNKMSVRNVVTWSTMVASFAQNNEEFAAIELVRQMQAFGVTPDAFTFTNVLPACARIGAINSGKELHGFSIRAGLDASLLISSSLIDMYAKLGHSTAAASIFNKMNVKNVVTWSTMVANFAQNYNELGAIELVRQMEGFGLTPDSVTLTNVLPACARIGALNSGKEIHGFSIRAGLDDNLSISSSLIDMYAKLGHSTMAASIFNKMSVRNVVTWSTMVACFALNNNDVGAIEVVRRMQACGETPNAFTFTNVLPACARIGALNSGKEIHSRCVRSGAALNVFVSNALIDMYANCGFLDLAENVFDVSFRNRVSYNTLLVGYSQSANCLTSLSLFKEMGLIGMDYDRVSFIGAIAACTNCGALKSGQEIHGFTMRRLFDSDSFISSSLLNLYTKCGKIGMAQKILELRLNKDVASWNTMILGYGMLGEFETAINLFETMREDVASHDSISFLAVLTACCHGGLVEQGRNYFEEMQAKGPMPTHMHYTCMINLLGRAGLMEEAAQLIRELPFEPEASIWGALLGASSIHGNIELAKWAAEHLFVLNPEDPGPYAVYSSMLSEAGRWDEAARVREIRKSRGIKNNNVAYSWVHGQGQVRAFLVGEGAGGSDLAPSLAYSA